MDDEPVSYALHEDAVACLRQAQIDVQKLGIDYATGYCSLIGSKAPAWVPKAIGAVKCGLVRLLEVDVDKRWLRALVRSKQTAGQWYHAGFTVDEKGVLASESKICACKGE